MYNTVECRRTHSGDAEVADLVKEHLQKEEEEEEEEKERGGGQEGANLLPHPLKNVL